MNKKKNLVFLLTLVAILIIGVWFVMDKKDNQDLDISFNEPSLSPTPIPTQATNQWVEYSNGLKIQDTVIGPGLEAKKGSVIAANYLGKLDNEKGRLFDSSYERGKPFSFILGSGQVIQGWDEGIVGMKVGGKRKLIIPSSMGYGSREVGGGLIPANSILYFEVELLEVQEVKPR